MKSPGFTHSSRSTYPFSFIRNSIGSIVSGSGVVVGSLLRNDRNFFF